MNDTLANIHGFQPEQQPLQPPEEINLSEVFKQAEVIARKHFNDTKIKRNSCT